MGQYFQRQNAQDVVGKVNNKQIVTTKNSIYHTRQLSVKILKVQSCKLNLMHFQGKSGEVYH